MDLLDTSNVLAGPEASGAGSLNNWTTWVSHRSKASHDYDWSTPNAFDWQERAACANRPFEWFIVKERGWIKKQLPNMEKGQAVCAACPVKEQCLSTADTDDLYWTMRGGKLPGRIANPTTTHVTPKPKPVPPSPPTGEQPGRGKGIVRGKKCRKNHDDWLMRKNGRHYCRPCANEYERHRYGIKGRAGRLSA